MRPAAFAAGLCYCLIISLFYLCSFIVLSLFFHFNGKTMVKQWLNRGRFTYLGYQKVLRWANAWVLKYYFF